MFSSKLFACAIIVYLFAVCACQLKPDAVEEDSEPWQSGVTVTTPKYCAPLQTCAFITWKDQEFDTYRERDVIWYCPGGCPEGYSCDHHRRQFNMKTHRYKCQPVNTEISSTPPGITAPWDTASDASSTKPDPESIKPIPKTLIPPESETAIDPDSTTPVPSTITDIDSTTPVSTSMTDPDSTTPAPTTITDPESTTPVPSTITDPDSTIQIPSTITYPDSTAPIPSTTADTDFTTQIPTTSISSASASLKTGPAAGEL